MEKALIKVKLLFRTVFFTIAWPIPTPQINCRMIQTICRSKPSYWIVLFARGRPFHLIAATNRPIYIRSAYTKVLNAWVTDVEKRSTTLGRCPQYHTYTYFRLHLCICSHILGDNGSHWDDWLNFCINTFPTHLLIRLMRERQAPLVG